MKTLAKLVPFALLPAACAPSAPDAGGVDPNLAVRSDVSQICVIRPVLPSALPRATYVLRDDGRLVGWTRGPSYLCWDAHPGPHHLTSGASPDAPGKPAAPAAIDVTLVNGRRSFVRQSSTALDLLPEPDARAALADLRFANLEASPGEAPLAVAAVDGQEAATHPGDDGGRAPNPPGVPVAPPPARPPQRPDGIVYGAAAGVGGGLWRAATATTPSPGFAALGSIWVGASGFDLVVVGLRIDVGLVGSGGTGDVALHLAAFPGARSRGPIRDFMLFADAGIGGPLSLSSGLSFGASGVAGIGRVGVAWEGWRIRSAALGPFLAAEAERGAGITQSAALTGIWMSIYSESRR
jgi:hypothetical protein